jgi:3alpha(or 20beta)-hydroxysteroid dehydrogenase
MSDYTDRVLVVTGGAGGLGAAVARRFAAGGASVVIADMQQDAGQALASELGPRHRFVRLDVTDEQSWEQIPSILEELGKPCSALVQCAGILHVGGIIEQEPEKFRRTLDVNLYGTWLGMHVLGPSLQSSGEGAIVNFSSTQGIYAGHNMGAYVASKWGVRGLTKTAAREFGHSGVRVLSIHPGPINTEMAGVFDERQFGGMAIARFGRPEEVAEMVWFMVTGASFSTGSEFVIDGGILLGPVPADA